MNLYQNEKKIRKEYELIAGVDEAGRGPLAGPVVIAAVILDPQQEIYGLNDSKQLSKTRLQQVFDSIQLLAREISVQIIPPAKIDELNILQATLYGMERAVLALENKPDLCLIDGNQMPKGLADFARCFVKGDAKFASIAAASIVAKVTRDRIMQDYHKTYPAYNFAKNKGYPTREHLLALDKHGITPIHRRSFRPVYELQLDL